MTLVRRLELPLRAGLALLLGLLVLLQTFSFPGQFAYRHPDEPGVRWLLTGFTAVELLCLEVVVVCAWRLLTLVLRDEAFSPTALRYVDTVLAALGTAWLLAAGLSAYAVTGADDPGGPLLLFVVLLCAGVFALLVLVARQVLAQATARLA